MTSNFTSWLFFAVLLVTGILNVILVHAVPGAFYLVLSFFYFPPTNALLKERFGFSVPFVLKVVVGLVVLWGTLAVGDLAEILGL